ncbi:MAG: MBOAT family protein [Euryarchaeota archaeon]|nr:MBOAT family protein [Euryarchaeota archaeon]
MACEALFNSPCFLFLFLPATLVLYWAVPHRTWKVAMLAVSGLVFYSFWDVRFAGLLVATAAVDYVLALRIAAGTRKKLWLVCSVSFNLGILAVFKYALFALDGFRSLFAVLGSPIEVPYASIVLPVGISFFTFKTMSYTIDVYRGEVAATRNFLKYLAFVSMFPDLVAGPIVRYRSISSQLDELPRVPQPNHLNLGLYLFSIGLAKKVLIADTIAQTIDPLWSPTATLSTPGAWVAAVGFSLQLFFDFSGYSDMALGLGYFLGLRLPQNFDAPFQASSPSDFWKRWHISLSSWFRDYLYIPLGGNRRGARRTALNLMLVMVLAGMWHGASWTFAAWGAFHGLLLLGHRALEPQWASWPSAVQKTCTFFLITLGWVLFRAETVDHALVVYARMLVPTGLTEGFALSVPVLVGVSLLVAVLFVGPLRNDATLRARHAVFAAAALFASIVMLNVRPSPFLYYRF